jgi:hypothetical protein
MTCKFALSKLSRFCSETAPWRHVEEESFCFASSLEVIDQFHGPAAVPISRYPVLHI